MVPNQPDVERRGADRLVVDRCRACRSKFPVTAVTRTDYAVYFRCNACGDVFSLPKPQFLASQRSSS